MFSRRVSVVGHQFGLRLATITPSIDSVAARLLHSLGVLLFLFLLSPPALAAQSLNLAWDADSTDPGLAGYRIYYGTASHLYQNTNQVGNVTTATVSGLQAGTRYYFAVVDYSPSGMVSPPSNEVSYQVPASGGGPVNPVISWTTPSNVVYGTALSAVQLNATATVPGSFAYTPPAGTILAVGNARTLTAVFTPSDLTSYNKCTNTVSFSVLRAPLTITANGQSKVYGAALPALGASYTGFINGEGVANLATPASLNTTASVASHVGSYPIAVGGATAVNYAIAFVNGALSVTPARLTISADNKSMVKGAAVPALTASYAGFVNGAGPAILSAPVHLATPATSASPAGTYPITASGAAGADYAITEVNGVLTITPSSLVSLVISAPTNSLVAGATQQFAALGTFADGTKQDLASSAAWTTTAPSVATVNASGLATAVGVGSAVISATKSGLTGSLALNVVSLPATNKVVFATTSAITIRSYGASSPYPSPINVSGLSGTVTKLTVTLTGFSHTAPHDVNLLLVGPSGAKAVLMANVGGTNRVSNLTLTFDDSANSSLSSSSTLISGTFRPTQSGSSPVLPSPAPAGPYVTSLSTFKGLSPDGQWSLYVADDTFQHSGQITGGWNLTISAVTSGSVSLAQQVPTGPGGSTPQAGGGVSNLNVQSLTMLPGGQVQLSLSGQTGQAYHLLTSTDLINWEVIYSDTAPNEQFTLIDAAGASSSRRFYRVEPANAPSAP